MTLLQQLQRDVRVDMASGDMYDEAFANAWDAVAMAMRELGYHAPNSESSEIHDGKHNLPGQGRMSKAYSEAHARVADLLVKIIREGGMDD